MTSNMSDVHEYYDYADLYSNEPARATVPPEDPVNFLDHTQHKGLAGAVFGGLFCRLVVVVLAKNPLPFTEDPAPENKEYWKILALFYYPALYYPLLACGTLHSRVGYVLGSLLSWTHFGVLVWQKVDCPQTPEIYKFYSLLSSLPQIVCLAFLSFQYPLLLFKNSGTAGQTNTSEVMLLLVLLVIPTLQKVRRGVNEDIAFLLAGFNIILSENRAEVVEIVKNYLWTVEVCYISTVTLSGLVTLVMLMRSMVLHRSNLKGLYRGDIYSVYNRQRSIRPSRPAIVCWMGFTSYQAALVCLALLIQTLVFFICILWFVFLILIPILYGQNRILFRILKVMWPFWLMLCLVVVVQHVMAKFAFLKKDAGTRDLDNRQGLFLLTYLLFPVSVLVEKYFFLLVRFSLPDNKQLYRYRCYVHYLKIKVSQSHPVMKAFCSVLLQPPASEGTAGQKMSVVEEALLYQNSTVTALLYQNSTVTALLYQNSTVTALLYQNSTVTALLYQNSTVTALLYQNSTVTALLYQNSTVTALLYQNSTVTALLYQNSTVTALLYQNSTVTALLYQNSTVTALLYQNSTVTALLYQNSTVTAVLYQNSTVIALLNQNSTNSTAIPEQHCNSTAIPEQHCNSTAIPEQHCNSTAIPEQHCNSTAIPEQHCNSTAIPEQHCNSTAIPEQHCNSTAIPEQHCNSTAIPEQHCNSTAIPEQHCNSTAIPEQHCNSTAIPEQHCNSTAIPEQHCNSTAIPEQHCNSTAIPEQHCNSTAIPEQHCNSTAIPEQHCNSTAIPEQHCNSTAIPEQHCNSTAIPEQHCNSTAIPEQHCNSTVIPEQHCNSTAIPEQHCYTRTALKQHCYTRTALLYQNSTVTAVLYQNSTAIPEQHCNSSAIPEQHCYTRTAL
ncbi:UNVERIFIED_CONTAM: hypothetical protein FKN15_041708 [Acipenser sinensis]